MADKNKNNYPYIGIAIVVVIVLAIFFISNSNNNLQNEVICNSPYIKVGTSCCLDQNYNSVCDNDEQNTQQETSQQEEVKRNVMGLDAIDYDKKTKQIIAPKVSYNEWISDWNVEVIGYDSNGNEVFNKEGSNNAGYSNNDKIINFDNIGDIPYLEDGSLTIKFISEEENLEVTGSYQYSTFDSTPSFNVEYLGYDSSLERFKYKITNTGKRYLYVGSIVSVVFRDECGRDSFNNGDWVARMVLEPLGYSSEYATSINNVLSNGQSLTVQGIAPSVVDSGHNFCIRFNYELPYWDSPVETNKELSFTA